MKLKRVIISYSSLPLTVLYEKSINVLKDNKYKIIQSSESAIYFEYELFKFRSLSENAGKVSNGQIEFKKTENKYTVILYYSFDVTIEFFIVIFVILLVFAEWQYISEFKFFFCGIFFMAAIAITFKFLFTKWKSKEMLSDITKSDDN